MNEKAVGEMPGRKRRKIIIVNKMLQFRFGIIIFLSSLLITLIVAIFIYITINHNILKSYNLGPEISGAIKFVNNLLIVEMLIYSVVISIISLFISHKFAGPLYRFEKAFLDLEKGDLTSKVNLRKADELQYMQEKFNRMIDSLNSKMKIVHKTCSKLDSEGSADKAREVREAIDREFKL